MSARHCRSPWFAARAVVTYLVVTSAAEPAEETAAPRPLLLSLRPRFARAILEGTKTVELRRTRLTASSGTLLILYASAPVMSVVGVARLASTVIDTPDSVWNRYGHFASVSRAEYDQYFVGARLATAVLLDRPRRLESGYSLAELREAQVKFRPPQSFRYLAEHDPPVLQHLSDEVLCGA